MLTMASPTNWTMGSRVLTAMMLTACMAAAPAQAQSTAVDTARSRISAVSKQMNVPVEGVFKRFSAQVAFDPAKPVDARASFEIDMASYDLGDADFNREVAKKEWFNAAQFPRASFVSTGVKVVSPGRLEVAGKLTIKGRTVDVVAPTSVKSDASGTVFEGVVPIRRNVFSIGEGEWKDTSIVADEVQVKFRIQLTSK